MRKRTSWFFAAAIAMTATIGVSAAGVEIAEKLYAPDADGSPQKPVLLLRDNGQTAVKTLKAKSKGASSVDRLRKAATVAPAATASVTVTERSDVPTLYGLVVYADHWQAFDQLDGLYIVPGNSSQKFEFLIPGLYAVNGGYLKDNIYYSAKTTVNEFLQVPFTYFAAYDVTTGEWLMEKPCIVSLVSMTYDPVSENVYAIALDANGAYLGTVTYEEYGAKVNYIGRLKGEWNSMAAGKDGQLYGIRVYYEKQGEESVATFSELYKIDKTTAEQTLVGETGMKPQYPSSAAIDPLSGVMYWTVSRRDDIGILAEVDLNTGKATAIYHYPHNEEICGLAVSTPEAYPKSPAAVSDASVKFNNGSLKGNISFTAPKTLFDGSAPSDNLLYTVLANGSKIADGFIRYGEKTDLNVTMEAPGLYDFMIYVSNSTGDSPRVRIDDIFVGMDTPNAPVATLNYTDGKMNLAWDAVTTAVNNGYIDADAVRYTVRRYPDDTVVAENIAETSFSEPLGEPATVTDYYYTVTASCQGKESAPGRSNTVRLGSIKPPFVHEFENRLGSFTTVDANNDGNCWFWDDMHRSARLNSYLADCDDWLLSPAITLKAGNAYKIYINAATASLPESMEVKMGKGSEVSDLTTTVIAPVTFQAKESDPRQFVATVTPETDGEYTIGIHGTSPADNWYLFIQRFEISSSFSANVPQAIADLTAVPATGGVLEASISFTAPRKSINGNDLTALDKIELLRGETIVKTFDAPECGSALSFTDKVDKEGFYSYTVRPYSAEGSGDPSTCSVYIGTGLASAPADVKFTHAAGKVTLTWDAVTTNEYGTAINPSDVKYNIYTVPAYAKRELLQEGVSGTTFSYQAVEEGKQEFMQYAVYPVTEVGEGQGTVTALLPVGTPYDGISESGELRHSWHVSGSGASWIVVPGNTEDVPIPTQDGDKTLFVMSGQNVDDYGLLESGMISLEKLTRPTLTFHTFPLGSADKNEMSVFVTDIATGQQTELTHFVESTLPAPDQWNRVMLSLEEFAGKTITLTFKGVLKTHELVLLDNITVGSVPANDLMAVAVSAPTRAYTGSTFTAVATVRNETLAEATGYTVELYSGDRLIASKNGTALAGNTSAGYEFEVEMHALATEPMPLHAAVVFGADEVAANNICEAISVDALTSRLTAPADLRASNGKAGVELQWDEPDIADGVALPMTEDFENAESWARGYGDWQFIDIDQRPVGGIMGVTTPTVDYSISKLSFFVFDNTADGMDASFTTNSGKKFLASFFLWDNSQVDDWAVSPELDGSAQTIYFYARSYSGNYPETIEVYYTKSDASEFNTGDYVRCARYPNIPGYFNEFKAEIPEGATHFAIRNCGTAAYMLMVDDVTFIPDSPRTDVSLMGYNIYRNGVKLNDQPLEETAYTDSDAVPGNSYSYIVTAIYDKGISAPSNVAHVDYTGLSDGIADNIVIRTERHSICVSGTPGKSVTVYSVDGKNLYSGILDGRLTVSVPQGAYVVKAGNKVVKVIVK